MKDLQLLHCKSFHCVQSCLQVYERLDELGADCAEVKASSLLRGLGFTQAMMNKKCKEFSGGWRMRVALAR